MTPVLCRVKHDPEAGTYGDCMRAAVASLMDVANGDDVPHFYHDNCDAVTGNERIAEWLATRGYVPFWAYYSGEQSLAVLLEVMGTVNRDVHYLLIGSIEGGGSHVVVCRGGAIVHNPAWIGCSLIGPNENGYWGVMVIARK